MPDGYQTPPHDRATPRCPPAPISTAPVTPLQALKNAWYDLDVALRYYTSTRGDSPACPADGIRGTLRAYVTANSDVWDCRSDKSVELFPP